MDSRPSNLFSLISALAKMSNLKLDVIGKRIQSLENKRQDDDSEKILAWVSPISFRSRQADVLEGLQQGTGKWFLEDDRFLSWINGEVQTLWCPGIRKTEPSEFWSREEC